MIERTHEEGTGRGIKNGTIRGGGIREESICM